LKRPEPPCDVREDTGFIAVEWVVAIVFLLLPVVLIGAGVSRWPERQQVARAAAAEAARAAVLSETQAGAQANASTVAAQVAANYGVDADQFEVTVSTPNWDWGEPVTVTVTMAMPTLDVPGVGSWSTTRWSASSTQRIEDYRGLE
jgi:Flp pilus assembly protein TadG